MDAEELQRIAYITHIHEAAAKNQQINNMLKVFYRKVCVTARLNGIQLSTLLIPNNEDEESESSINEEAKKPP